MKTNCIYKENELVAEHSKFGWIVYLKDVFWIRAFLKEHSNELVCSEQLLSLVRDNYFDAILKKFKI